MAIKLYNKYLLLFSVHQRYFSSSRDSLAAAYINRAAVSSASELDLSRKVRRRDIRGRLKLPPSVGALASSGDVIRWGSGPRSSSGNINGNLNTASIDHLHQRRPGHPTRIRSNWSFVFDPAGRLCYYWSMVVSLAFLYNFWVIIYRFAFQEINSK